MTLVTDPTSGQQSSILVIHLRHGPGLMYLCENRKQHIKFCLFHRCDVILPPTNDMVWHIMWHHKCGSTLHHVMAWCLVNSTPLMNQCWLSINETLRKKNKFDEDLKTFYPDNALKYVICKMVAIFFWPQCVNHMYIQWNRVRHHTRDEIHLLQSLVLFTDKKKGGCRWTITHTHNCWSKFLRELVIWNMKLAFCKDKIKMLNIDSCDTDEEISCYNIIFDSRCTGDIWHQTISHRNVITKCIRKAWSFQLYVSMVRRNIECELGSIVCSDKKGSIKNLQ